MVLAVDRLGAWDDMGILYSQRCLSHSKDVHSLAKGVSDVSSTFLKDQTPLIPIFIGLAPEVVNADIPRHATEKSFVLQGRIWSFMTQDGDLR